MDSTWYVSRCLVSHNNQSFWACGGGTDLRRRVIGKSGFVEGVSCLSGLLKARDGQWYAFSIMMNHIPYKSNSLAKSLQERIIRALDVHVTAMSVQR